MKYLLALALLSGLSYADQEPEQIYLYILMNGERNKIQALRDTYNIKYKTTTKEKNMSLTDELKTFIDKYKTLENEIKMLQEDKKILIEDLKDNHGISPKVIRKAIQVAKIRTAMGDELVQLDNIVEQLEGSIV